MENVRAVRFDRRKRRGHFLQRAGLPAYNPIGSVHGGYAAILLDSAMGLAVHTTLLAGTGYTTLEFKISFIKGMTKDTGPVKSEGRTLSVGRARAATAEARITDSKGRLLAHATTTCLVFRIRKHNRRERGAPTAVDNVGWAKRSVPTILLVVAVVARAKGALCPPSTITENPCPSSAKELRPLTFDFADDGLVPNSKMPFLV